MDSLHSTDLPGPSRDRILDLLRWGPLTVEELAEEVGLTLNGIRAQLTGLERDGLVMRAGLRHSRTAGKPPVLYALTKATEEAFSNAYPQTLLTMVSVLRKQLGEDALLATLREVGREMAAAHLGNEPVRVLEALGAKVQIHPQPSGGEHIEGGSCPLADAVRHEPKTCEVVRSLLATATGREVTMCCQHGDAPRCGFRVAG